MSLWRDDDANRSTIPDHFSPAYVSLHEAGGIRDSAPILSRPRPSRSLPKQKLSRVKIPPARVWRTYGQPSEGLGTGSKKWAGDERDSATVPGPARGMPAFSIVPTDQKPGKGALFDTATGVW